MSDIVRESADDAEEKLRNFVSEYTKEEMSEWKEALLRIFLANY